MSNEFVPISCSIDHIVAHADLGGLSDEQKQLIRDSGLPGARELFDTRDPDHARKALRQLAEGFFAPGSGQ